MSFLYILVAFIFLHSKSYDFEKLQIDIEWQTYKEKYGLKFSYNEDVERKLIFEENYNFVLNHNSKKSNFSLKINKLAHLVISILIRKTMNLQIMDILRDEPQKDMKIKLEKNSDFRKLSIGGQKD